MPSRETDSDPRKRAALSGAKAARSAVGGILMGLANLVPGISGGTMLLAAGVYPEFIHAIAELSTFRIRFRTIALLATVVGAAAVAIVLGAGPIKGLVIEHRWLMYSFFIGLTLGGAPVVWALVDKPVSPRVLVSAVGGFLAMGILAWLQSRGAAGGETVSGFGWMFLAGVAGASAMILPGVSGGYLLLVLGVYLPLLAAIDRAKEAARGGQWLLLSEPLMEVLVPVGLGVVVGVVFVSNLLKLVLRHQPQITYGVLLGFLLGAVMGLWPFQRGVLPALGSSYKGQLVDQALVASLSPEKYPTVFFTPTPTEVAVAIAAVAAGFAVTVGVARFSPKEASPASAAQESR